MVRERRSEIRLKPVLVIAAVLIATLSAIAEDTKKQKASDSREIEVYKGPTAPKPFILIGEIHAKGSTERTLMNKMKSLARQHGANAILSYSIEAGINASYWTGAVLSNAEGIAVRWAAEGEDGITKITSDMSIPVIQ